MSFRADLATKALNFLGDSLVDAFLGAKITIGEVITELTTLIAKLALAAAIKAGLSAAFPGLAPFLAEGGDAVAGKPYIVGEAGPELFVPNNSGYVVSNNKLQQIGKTARENASYLAFNGGSRAATVNHKIDIKLRGSLKSNKNDFVFDFNKADKKVRKGLSVGDVNVYNT